MSDTDTERSRGYEQTDFEIVVHRSGNYELPVSTAARYRMVDETSPKAFIATLENHGYAFIAPYTEGGYLSSKVYDSETNEFCHLKVSNGAVLVYPKSETFSKATFERLVECIDEHVVDIKLEVDEQ